MNNIRLVDIFSIGTSSTLGFFYALRKYENSISYQKNPNFRLESAKACFYQKLKLMIIPYILLSGLTGYGISSSIDILTIK